MCVVIKLSRIKIMIIITDGSMFFFQVIYNRQVLASKYKHFLQHSTDYPADLAAKHTDH